MQMLGSRNSAGGGVAYDDGPSAATPAAAPAKRPAAPKPMDDMEDDIPF
jgi:single-stranded DNA-binding protein